MEQRTFERTWIEGKSPDIDDLAGYLFQGEASADTFVIDGETSAGEAVEITGTIIGVYLGENNSMVPLVGAVDDGKAVITLEDACYKLPGRFVLTVYAVNGAQTVCLYTGIGHMFRTQSARVAYPSKTIPDIQDLIEGAETVIGQLQTLTEETIATIEAKGEETLASIPDDYTTLANEVTALNETVVIATVAETQEYLGLT